MELIEEKFPLISVVPGLCSYVAKFLFHFGGSVFCHVMGIAFLFPTKYLRNPESDPAVLKLVTT